MKLRRESESLTLEAESKADIKLLNIVERLLMVEPNVRGSLQALVDHLFEAAKSDRVNGVGQETISRSTR